MQFPAGAQNTETLVRTNCVHWHGKIAGISSPNRNGSRSLGGLAAVVRLEASKEDVQIYWFLYLHVLLTECGTQVKLNCSYSYLCSLVLAIDAFESRTKEKRPQFYERHDKVNLEHDNARPDIAKVVIKYLETLK